MLRYVLLVAAVLMAPATAQSRNPQFTKVQLCQVLQPCEPPAEFATGPFLAPPAIREVALRDIQAVCGPHPFLAGRASADTSIMGCARFQGASCVVHVPADVKVAIPELYDVILRHELAHCRGWIHQAY